ncbi:MAG: Dabb family protein [Chloroflexota bacterium]|nr:Dabb family protein [Chloroflexota bacterium]MDQ5864367.1 Dabb family protein [Chloroflexota bacterium]
MERKPYGIQHILQWSYKDGVPAEECARIEAELERLPGLVPSLRHLEWGQVVGGRNQSFSHCFVMYFDNMQGLADYATHPDHVRFAGAFREACAVQVVTDFEVKES